MDESKRRDRPGQHRRVSLVGPVILIGLGVVFLLNNMGVLAWSVWDVIFRLWPVLLIAVGLEIILSRLSPWGSLLALALTVIIIAGALWLLGPDMRTAQAVAGEEVNHRLAETHYFRQLVSPRQQAMGNCSCGLYEQPAEIRLYTHIFNPEDLGEFGMLCLGLDQHLAEVVVEAAHDFTGELQMGSLVHTDGNRIGFVERDVSSHQHWVPDQSIVDVIRLLAYLLLERR